MRIDCPSCAVTYEVPASRLAPGKMVRCMRCGGEWIPVLENEQQVAEAKQAEEPHAHYEPAAPVPTMTAMDRLAATSTPPPSRISLLGAWVLTFVVLSGALAATFIWRDPIVRAWPPLGRILAIHDAGMSQNSKYREKIPRSAQTAGVKAE